MSKRELKIYYVSPRGRDDAQGVETAPFATMERARDAVRHDISNGATGEIHVLFRDGLYRTIRTVVLDERDSGNSELAITYAAYPGENPVFSSGAEVQDWRPLEETVPGLPGAAAGKIWTAELPEACGPSIYTLYEDGARLQRARTDGFVPRTSDTAITDNHTLHFPAGALKKWNRLEDAELVIRPSYPWSLNILPLAEVDETACVAKTRVDGTYRLIECHHFVDSIRESCWVENVFEGMNRPGRWVFDSAARRIYLWPTGNVPGRVTAPCLTELVRIDNGGEDRPLISNITFRNLWFTQGDRLPVTNEHATTQHEWELFDSGNALLRLRGTTSCAVRGCRFSDSGGTAVRIDLDGLGNEITGNTISRMGGTGIFVGGYGPGLKNASRENRIEANVIHHIGEITWHAPAIFVWHSSANLVASNLIHHTNYIAIVVSGSRPFLFGSEELRTESNDHYSREFRPVRRSEIGSVEEWNELLDVDSADGTNGFQKIMERIYPYQHTDDNRIEGNEIHHVVELMGDGNAIYLSDTGKGNVVRGNYIYDLEGQGGQQAIRTDAFIIGTTISHNIIHRCNGGGINVKHYENDVINNIISDIRTIESSSRSGQAERLYFGYISLVSVLPRKYLRPDQVVRIRGNILLKTNTDQSFYRIGKTDGLSESDHIAKCKVLECDLDKNLYFSIADTPMTRDIVSILREYGLEEHGMYADPQFTDPENGDFVLRETSPAHRLGIEQLKRPSIPEKPIPTL